MAARLMVLVLGMAFPFASGWSNEVLPHSDSANTKKVIPSTTRGASPMQQQSQPYIQLSQADLRTFVANVNKIKIGDTRQAVRELLGKPWSDHLARQKMTDKPIGRFVTYYVVKQDKSLVNEHLDKMVLFRFDGSDRLIKIVSKVPGISSRP